MSNTLRVKDRHDILEISFADVEKYHGFSSIAGAAFAYKALAAAFERLLPNDAPNREQIQIKSGHPGPGVRDAVEMVTRAITREAFTLDTNLPKGRLNPYRQLAFCLIVTVGDRQAEVVLRDGILPGRFFELMEIIAKAEGDTNAEKHELDQLKRTLAAQMMARSSAEMLDVKTAD